MALSLANKDLFYGQNSVLKKLNLTVKAGEKIAIIGESGSGKSTLLNALRELRPQDIAWCPQQPGLVPMLNCLHNIYMGQLQQHHFLVNIKRLIYPGAQINKEIHIIAQQLAIEDQLHKACQQLSGGQQQRTGIARAIYSGKDIFLGDEPVSALDKFQAQHILTHLCETFETLIITLHDIKLAQAHCQRIIALKDGEILFDKASDQLTQKELTGVYK